MAINLYLVRHGQTLFNAEKRMQGSCDSPLTKLGIKQAQALHAYFKLKGIIFNKAYCSTQERASDTLEIILGQKRKYVRLKELKEKNYGYLEGRKNFLWPLRFLPLQPKMEDNREVLERMQRGINLILRDAQAGDNILIVGHGDSLSRYVRDIVGYRKFYGFPNAGFVQLQSNGHTVKFVRSGWPGRNLKRHNYR